jgi:hypothetical protein
MPAEARIGEAEEALVVSDHVNLAFWSPLQGPNDERVGPRFPVTAGLYCPEIVQERYPVEDGVAAEVGDPTCLTEFERWAIHKEGTIAAVTNELAAVAILAAHAGFRLAAVMVPITHGETTTGRRVTDI